MPENETHCHVCGETLAEDIAVCGICERPFHLRTRENSPGTDCGEVWINQQFLALEYACNVCLGKTSSGEPPVAQGH